MRREPEAERLRVLDGRLACVWIGLAVKARKVWTQSVRPKNVCCELPLRGRYRRVDNAEAVFFS